MVMELPEEFEEALLCSDPHLCDLWARGGHGGLHRPKCPASNGPAVAAALAIYLKRMAGEELEEAMRGAWDSLRAPQLLCGGCFEKTFNRICPGIDADGCCIGCGDVLVSLHSLYEYDGLEPLDVTHSSLVIAAFLAAVAPLVAGLKAENAELRAAMAADAGIGRTREAY